MPAPPGRACAASFARTAAGLPFLGALREVLGERVPEAGTPPALDLVEAARLYQTLYWVARTAAAPTPDTDVLHVTAAGWSAIPAVVHKALHGTPMVLTEHGVYVREAYLAAARNGDSPGARFATTRLARGLARVAYEAADVVAPVTDANAHWEMGLGIDPAKILVLHNGLRPPAEPTLAPRTRTVVSVGRIDPLKDVHTMLRVAAEALAFVPDARFEHYGPVPSGRGGLRPLVPGAARPPRAARRASASWGPTGDPNAAVRAADVVLMTSISEGLPMSILEAMGQGRPVVATGVGGVPDVVRGCGAVCAPGDDHALAMAVVLLLRNPELAARLGSARAPPAEAHLHRVGLHRRLSRPAAGRGRAGRRAACPDRPGGMTAAPLEPADGELIVEARLGRPPQDMLEAAVVLEAWAGVPAQSALAAARELMPEVPRTAQPSVGRLPAPSVHQAGLLPGAAFIVTVIAIACWAVAAGREPRRPCRRARADARPAAHAGAAVGAAEPLPQPPTGGGAARRPAPAGSWSVRLPSWSCRRQSSASPACSPACWRSRGRAGTLLVGCRRPLTYAVVVLAATPAMIARAEVMAVLAAVAVATTAAVAVALRARAVPARPTPGRWPRAIAAGTIGLGLGLMLVLDRTVGFTEGAVPALALLPSTVASAWGGHHLRHLEQAIPRSVVRRSPRATRTRRGVAWPPFGVLLGALGAAAAAGRGALGSCCSR